MPRRKKLPADMNARAAAIVAELTGEAQEERHDTAVELGRKGGQKGGMARAAKLTPEQRQEIARKAAQARWGNR